MVLSSASRASSWRKIRPRRSRSSRPVSCSRRSVGRSTPNAGSTRSSSRSGAAAASCRTSRSPGGRPNVRASTASRAVTGNGRSGSLATSSTKNGFPPVICVDPPGVQRRVAEKFAHSVHAQRRQPQRREVIESGEIAEQRPGRVMRADVVVAIGDDDRAGHRLEPPHQEAEHLDRRGIHPVQIFDDQNGRLTAYVAEHRVAHRRQLGVPWAAMRAR